MASIKPFEMTVTGRAEIPHPAERALINVSVSSQGNNKATVADEVITTTKHIEGMLRELAPKNQSPEAKEAAPLAHWNQTSLSSTSFIPTPPMPYIPPDKDDKQSVPREYQASVEFDIRFKEFKALGTFGTKISSLPHVEVQNIDWILTDATERSYRSRLRREAALDALEKAKDYCDVLGCTNVRPIELGEGYLGFATPRDRMNARRMNASHQQMQMMSRSSMHSQSRRREIPGHAGVVPARDEIQEDLEFRPQEVRMSMEVTIKFHADPVKSSQ